MRHEAIALAIFVLSSLALFTGLMRRPQAGHVLGIIVAVAAAAYLVVALPPNLSPWARPHPQYRHAQALHSGVPEATTNVPITTASPVTSDGILVVALQGTFDVTKSVLSQLLQAATADKTRVVSDETVLQVIVGIALTALFAIFGFLIALVRRLFVPAAA